MATTTNGSREQQAPPPSATDVDKTYPFGHSGELGSLTTNETSISTAKRLRQRLQRQQSGQSGRSGVTGDELLRVGCRPALYGREQRMFVDGGNTDGHGSVFHVHGHGSAEGSRARRQEAERHTQPERVDARGDFQLPHLLFPLFSCSLIIVVHI